MTLIRGSVQTMAEDPWGDPEEDEPSTEVILVEMDKPGSPGDAHAMATLDVDPYILVDASPTERQRARSRRRPMALTPKRRGNTPRGMLAAARAQSIAQATGRGEPPSEDWREALHSGDRNRAIRELTRDSFTYNAGSGFGLA